MTRTASKTAAVVATVLAGTAIALPSAASAKTVKFTMTERTSKPAAPPDYKVALSSCKVSGKLGSGKCKSQTTPPKTVGQWRLNGGRIYYTFTTSLKGTVATGTGKITRGTGKFKGAKGTFKVRGDILGKFPFTMKGTVRY